MLVLPDEHAPAAAELCQLQQEEESGRVPAGTTATTLRLVAAILRYLRLHEAANADGEGSAAAAAAFTAAYPPIATVRIAQESRRLVSLAVCARWPHLATLLLPAVTADGCLAAAAVAELAALAAPAPTLLHLAVASGSAPTVATLAAWAAGEGVDWEAVSPAEGVPAAAQLDPLLLAAAMGPSLSEPLVEELMSEWRPGWLQVHGAAGLQPSLPHLPLPQPRCQPRRRPSPPPLPQSCLASSALPRPPTRRAPPSGRRAAWQRPLATLPCWRRCRPLASLRPPRWRL